MKIDPSIIIAGLPKNNALEIAVSPAFEKIGRFLESIQESLNKVDLNSLMAGVSTISTTILAIQETDRIRRERYPNLAKNLKEIASHSWFTNVLTDICTYERLGFIIEGVEGAERRSALIESSFSSHFKENIEWLGEIVIDRVPERAFAIMPALQAHARGEYVLSVPVFLSQAEGILRDITSAELFTKFDNITQYASAKRSEVIHDDSWIGFSDDAYWAQLSDHLPVGWGARDRKKSNYNGFNRNTTLHGIDLSYGTEVNSLKAFSLLCHVVGLIEIVNDESCLSSKV